MELSSSAEQKSWIPGIRKIRLHLDPPDFRDFSLGIFRDFQISFPILGISGFFGFGTRDFFEIFKSPSPAILDSQDFAI